MNQEIIVRADAGSIIVLIIVAAFAVLFVAAAYKFFTKKKGPSAPDSYREEEEPDFEAEDRAEEEKEKAPPPPKPAPIRIEVPQAKLTLKPRAEPAPAEAKPAPAAVPAPAPVPVPAPAPAPKPKSLQDGLSKTRDGFIGRINRVLFGGKKAAEEVREEIEEILFTADIGVKTSQNLLAFVDRQLSGKDLSNPARIRDALKAEILRIVDLHVPEFDLAKAKPFVIMMVGVNGVGKTTTIGKIGAKLADNGHKVIFAAGDTFRAAAAEQLEIWGGRADTQVIRGQDGGDPSAVIYDAISAAKSKGTDVVIADTAGRLHTKVPLMDELKKMKRVTAKAMEGAPHEVLLVVDANTGQNAIAQAREFNEVLGITGIILTKLDGTAKGGVIIGICDELKVPVRYIGIGEGVDDLRVFDPKEFTDALFAE
ncbi:MAG: signal recognition particle-docking protein FtsY [Myxococcota bacterium]|jgi:fused signal recognition particle receptor